MFRPTQDYVLVKPLDRIASTLIAVILDERPNLVEIVAIGPGKIDKKGRLHPLDVKVGQTVRIGEFMFPEIYFHGNNQKYLVIQEADIAGVVDE